MTRMRPSTGPTAGPTAGSANIGAAASAALDQLDRPSRADEAYDHYLHQLHLLDTEVREGGLTIDDLPARRSAILAELRDAVLHTQPDPVLTRVGDLWRELGVTLDSLYVPGGSASASVPLDNRYAMQWTGTPCSGPVRSCRTWCR